MKIHTFRRRTLKERLLRLWPSYRRKQDAELKAGLKYLMDHPEAPCIVGDTFIPDGLGSRESERGSFTLAVVIVVAAVVVVGLGGCVVYKLQKKVNDITEKRKVAETNEVDNFAGLILQDYQAQTGDSGAFVMTSITWATQDVNVAVVWQVQTSTNLIDWQVVLETDDSAAADSAVSQALSEPRTEAMRFFRLLSK